MPAKRASRNKLNKDDEKNGGGGEVKKEGREKKTGERWINCLHERGIQLRAERGGEAFCGYTDRSP